MLIPGKDALAILRSASAKHIRCILGVLAVVTSSLGSLGAQAQTTIFQENFSNGLGGFTAGGSVATTAGNALIRGSLSGVDGAITSAQYSTAGFSNLSLSFDRTTSAL